MKTFKISLLSIILLSIYSISNAQFTPPIDEVTELVSYQEVVQVEGNPDELYIRAIAWINSEFKNPEDVTRVRDRNNGKIKGTSRFRINYTEKDVKRNAGTIEYTFILEFKEGRYRYTFTEFLLKDLSRQGIEKWLDKEDPAFNPLWEEYLKQVDEYTKGKIESLKKGMQPPKVKDDEW